MIEKDYRNREFETGFSFTRMKHIRSIHPHHLRDHARRILEDTERGYKRYRYAAELSKYVYEKIDYSKEDQVWRGDYLIEHKGEGDCEDQSGLLGSILSCRSYEVRFVVTRIENEDCGHAMVQVLFDDADIDRLTEEANDFYGDIGDLYYERDKEGRYWLNCDPTFSPVIGDIPPDHLSSSSRKSSVDGGEIEYRSDLLRDYLYPENT